MFENRPFQIKGVKMKEIPKNMTPEETVEWYNNLTPEEKKEFDSICDLAITRHKAYKGLKRQDAMWRKRLSKNFKDIQNER